MVKIQYATISETGKRKNNEDAFRMIGMSDGNRWLAVVCDGMGGHDKGEVASETVADAIPYGIWLGDNRPLFFLLSS